MSNEPDWIECLRIIEAHYEDRDEDRTFIAQILLIVRNLLRKQGCARRLEMMSVYEILELADRRANT